MAITLSHRIEIKINNEFKTYCRKAFGISRFTWNWALEKVKEKISNKQKVNDNVPVPLRQTSEDEENQKLTRLEIKA